MASRPARHKNGGQALQSATKTADKKDGGQARQRPVNPPSIDNRPEN